MPPEQNAVDRTTPESDSTTQAAEENGDAAALSVESDMGIVANNEAPSTTSSPAEPSMQDDPEPARTAPSDQTTGPTPAVPEDNLPLGPGEIVAQVDATSYEVVALLSAADVDATFASDGAVEVVQADAAAASELLMQFPPGRLVVRVATDVSP